jgi:hypothetical protein
VSVDIIVPIIIAIIAAAPGAYALWRQTRLDLIKQPQQKVADDITASSVAADVIRKYATEIQSMRTELHDLRTEVESLQGKLDARDQVIEEWRLGIERLSGQVVSLGHKPVWQPKAKQSET